MWTVHKCVRHKKCACPLLLFFTEEEIRLSETRCFGRAEYNHLLLDGMERLPHYLWPFDGLQMLWKCHPLKLNTDRQLFVWADWGMSHIAQNIPSCLSPYIKLPSVAGSDEMAERGSQGLCLLFRLLEVAGKTFQWSREGWPVLSCRNNCSFMSRYIFLSCICQNYFQNLMRVHCGNLMFNQFQEVRWSGNAVR